MSEQRTAFINPSGDLISGVLNLPRRKTKKAVLICHGFKANKDQAWIIHLSKRLENAGFACLRFDFSGNGESKGNLIDATYSKEVIDLRTAVDFMENLGFIDIAVVGHSMGGGVALLEASKDARIRTVVDMAAPAYPGAKEIFLRKALDEMKMKDQDRLIRNLHKTDVLGPLRKVKVPVLIVHGDKDKRVDLAESKEILSRLSKRSRLIMMKGCGHNYKENSQEVQLAGKIVPWIKKNI